MRMSSMRISSTILLLFLAIYFGIKGSDIIYANDMAVQFQDDTSPFKKPKSFTEKLQDVFSPATSPVPDNRGFFGRLKDEFFPDPPPIQTMFNKPEPTATPTPTPTPVPKQFFKEDKPKFAFGELPSNAKEKLTQFYNRLGNPPLTGNIDDFLTAAKQYGIDYRILPLIGQIESSSGKNYPTESFNPFGYLGGKGATAQEKLFSGFTSLPHTIDRMSKRFSTRYPKFKENPTFKELQTAYNANPAEQEKYLRQLEELYPYFD